MPLQFPVTRKHIAQSLCFNVTHQFVSQSRMTAASLEGGGDGGGGCDYVLLARCYGCRALS